MEDILVSRMATTTSPASSQNDEKILTLRQLKMLSMQPHLRALRLQETVRISRQVIRDAWQSLILDAHPDKGKHVEDMNYDSGFECQAINTAKDTLLAMLDKVPSVK